MVISLLVPRRRARGRFFNYRLGEFNNHSFRIVVQSIVVQRTLFCYSEKKLTIQINSYSTTTPMTNNVEKVQHLLSSQKSSKDKGFDGIEEQEPTLHSKKRPDCSMVSLTRLRDSPPRKKKNKNLNIHPSCVVYIS